MAEKPYYPEDTRAKHKCSSCAALRTENERLINRCGEIGVERDVALGENERLKAWINKIRPKHRHDHEYFHVGCYLCDIEERDWEEFQQALSPKGLKGKKNETLLAFRIRSRATVRLPIGVQS